MIEQSTEQVSRQARLLIYGSLVLIALVAWGAAFLSPESKFWDDWVLANGDTLRMTRELGLPWTGYIYVAFFAVGAWTFKLVVVASAVVVGITTYAIAGRGLALNRWERWLLSALVVGLPLFSMRVLASVSTYSWSLALFFIAWYLLVRKEPDSQERIRYILAALLLFVSYTTASLLPFTALPVLHLGYLALRGTTTFWRDLARLLARFWFVLAAPVLFWVVRTLYLQPYGLYKGYNGLDVVGGAPSAHTSVKFIAAIVCVFLMLLGWRFLRLRIAAWLRELLFLGPLAAATAVLGGYIYAKRGTDTPAAELVPAVVVVCAILIAALAIYRSVLGILAKPGRGAAPVPRDRETTPILAIGLIVLILGMLPYLIVGKVPTFFSWDARNQLLMPIGVATIIVAAFRAVAFVLPRSIISVVSVAMVGVFTILSLATSLSLVADWRLQSEVIDALKSQPLVRSGRTIVFDDRASFLGYDGGGEDFYVYDGWMLTAFGDQTRLAIDSGSVSSFVDGDGVDAFRYAATRYGFGQYTGPTSGQTSAVLVEILPLPHASWWTLLTGQTSVVLEVSPVKSLASLHRVTVH